jgi:hypothetical protein
MATGEYYCGLKEMLKKSESLSHWYPTPDMSAKHCMGLGIFGRRGVIRL